VQGIGLPREILDFVLKARGRFSSCSIEDGASEQNTHLDPHEFQSNLKPKSSLSHKLEDICSFYHPFQ
jgi:hypothetical protein